MNTSGAIVSSVKKLRYTATINKIFSSSVSGKYLFGVILPTEV